MPPSIPQKFAINHELLNAIRLIQAGLGQLQKIDVTNDFYHLPLLTLSSGFERLIKVILCAAILALNKTDASHLRNKKRV